MAASFIEIQIFFPGIKEKEPKTKQKNVQNIVGKANTRKIFQNH